MSDANHYVPILKTKAGECGALRALKERTWAFLTPLLEVHEVPWDYTTDSPAKTIQDHVHGVREQLSSSIPEGATVFLDGAAVADAGAAPDGGDALNYIARSLEAGGVRVVPVTGMSRSEAYCQSTRELGERASQACIRVEADDVARSAGRLDAELTEALADLGLTRAHSTLVLDVGEIAQNALGPLALAMASIIGGLEDPSSWRRVVVAGTGMPPHLADVPPNEVTLVPRTEWALWKTLVTRAHTLPRVPCFGDYGVTNPNVAAIDPRVMKMAAKIKYTVSDDWLVARSWNVQDYGYEQAHDVCRLIGDHEGFCGVAFSDGDRFISDCAVKARGPGRAQDWVTAGTSHHLEFVADQVAKHPVPSGGS